MKHLVVHVGAHKTGTTLLQRTLSANRDALAADGYAIMVRRGFESAAGGLHGRWRKTGNTEDAHRAFAGIREAREGEQNLVISHEEILGALHSFRNGGMFYPGAEEATRALIAELRPERTTVILYTRRQDRFLESAYLQLIKQGWSTEFAEFMQPISAEALRWDSLVDRIEAALPDGSDLRLRYFEQITDLGTEDFCRDFVRLFSDAPLTFSFDAEQFNRGYSAVALRMAQAANADLGRDDRKLLRRFLEQNFSNVTHARPELLRPEERRALLGELAESNRALHRMIADDESPSPYLPSDG